MPYKSNLSVAPKTVIKYQYGSVVLLKMVCPDCKEEAVVIDGEMQCCGYPVDLIGDEREKRKRESEGESKRHKISKQEKQKSSYRSPIVVFIAGKS